VRSQNQGFNVSKRQSEWRSVGEYGRKKPAEREGEAEGFTGGMKSFTKV